MTQFGAQATTNARAQGASMFDTLLIANSFFGYAREIQRELERRGRQVAYFEDRPATDALTKSLVRVAPSTVRARADAYFEAILAQMKGCPIRDVLVIRGEAMSAAMARRMRAALPNARFTLYFWDSFGNMPEESRQKVDIFDRVLTFDPIDARADNRLIYRPLFYLDEYAHIPEHLQDIDVLFVGTVHGDRHAVLSRLGQVLPKHLRFHKVLYFQTRWLPIVRSLTDPTLLWADRSDFIFKPKAKAELTELIARSRIVIDIERPVQSGFTMRTIEILAAGRKLITTNAEVANADFFDPDNIAIVNRKSPELSKTFLETPYRNLSPQTVARYSLGTWLDDVLPDMS
jgi:hypothetical protein